MKNRSIAIDGPSGAGKSTLARMAAKHFGMIYVDTGALYRCIGLFAYQNGVDPKSEAAVTALLPDIKIDMSYDDAGVQRMFINGADVTDDIREPIISSYASDVSALPPVRAFLLDMQRDMAARYDVIMDGRDIGTIVLPNAGLKVFLTASAELRAVRRHRELIEKGSSVTFEEVLRDMTERDRNDSTRSIAPLKAADDAVLLDTTGVDLDGSFELLRAIISERYGI